MTHHSIKYLIGATITTSALFLTSHHEASAATIENNQVDQGFNHQSNGNAISRMVMPSLKLIKQIQLIITTKMVTLLLRKITSIAASITTKTATLLLRKTTSITTLIIIKMVMLSLVMIMWMLASTMMKTVIL